MAFRTFALPVAVAAGLAAAGASAQALPQVDVPPVVPIAPVRPLPPADASPPSSDPAAPAAAPAESGGCAPAGLFSATVRDISPGLAASSQRAQPRQLWRSGARFFRSLEQPQPNGRQALVIIAEPDIWAIDVGSRSGRHTTDPGPDLFVRAPILPTGADLPPELHALEFGCEMDFVAAHAPAAQQIIDWGSAKAGVHVFSSGEHSLAMLVDTRRNAPVMLSYLRQGRPVFVLRYDEYRRNQGERPQLFEPANNVRMTEGPAPAAALPSN